jgi:predicted flap endonuclease-1-like 5' DNA nuclease
MDNNGGKIELALGSWLVALAGGTLAGTLLWVLGGWTFLQGAFVGLLVVIVVGGFLSWTMTRPLPGPGEVKITPPTPGADARSTKVSAPKAAPVKAAPAPTASKVQPSKRLAGQEELAARKGDWKYGKDEPAKPAAKKTAPAKKAVAPAATDSADRPAHLTDAPAGTADDLKKISGVGPKLEQTLNSLGIWHFEQVAKLSKDDIAWVDARLRFKGRIERDDWTGQAKELAKAKG